MNKRPNILVFLVDQMPYDVLAPTSPCHMPNARGPVSGLRGELNRD